MPAAALVLPLELEARFKEAEIVGKGSYGTVFKAYDSLGGEWVALKRVHSALRNAADGLRVLREMRLLRFLRSSHDVVRLREVLLPPSKAAFTDLFLVFDLLDTDLHQVIKLNNDLQPAHFQWFLFQIVRGLNDLHSAGILHRDLKPRNILVNSNCTLKLCDLGLARTATPSETSLFWTDYVATRWYRAPELCGSFYGHYSAAVDVWSVGCIFAELLLGRPLFAGKDVVHQLELITDILGTPSPAVLAKIRNPKARSFLAAMPKKAGCSLHQAFPSIEASGVDLLSRMLAFDPDERISAQEALRHPYFANLQNLCHPEPVVQGCLDPAVFEGCPRMQVEDVRELLYLEILEYHPVAREAQAQAHCNSYGRSSTSQLSSLSAPTDMRGYMLESVGKGLLDAAHWAASAISEPGLEELPAAPSCGEKRQGSDASETLVHSF